MKDFLKGKRRWLLGQGDSLMLGAFRVGYGLFMTIELIIFIRIGFIKNMFVLPAINFKYDYLTWLKAAPELWMNCILAVLLVCTIAITLGVFFKWACRLFAIGFAYIFLLDKSVYNNHLYLFILLAILLSFTEADKVLSLRRKQNADLQVPRWQLFILQAQFVIVYFYGGIAKLTYDWLVQCQPIRFLIEQVAPDHFLAPFIKNELSVYTLSYGGLLLDLLAPVLLWFKPVRKWAIYPFIIFHLMNSRIFSDIGIFPYVMLFSLILFYDMENLPGGKWIIKWHSSVSGIEHKASSLPKLFGKSFVYKYVLVPYFVFQLLFPFRGHFLPNDLDWTTIGNRFSWRMKVDTRQIAEMKFTIIDPLTNNSFPVDIPTWINDMQVLNLSMDPRSVADFANLLKTEAQIQGFKDAQVKAVMKLIYNRRPPQYFVDPEVDLSLVDYSPFKKLDWVYPLNKD